MSDPDVPDVFTVNAAGGAGLSRGRSRNPLFTSPSRGVRVRTGAVSEHVVDHAALIGCRPDAVLCDVNAAKVWGLPLPPWLQFSTAPTAIAVVAGTAEPRRPGVRGRRLELPAEHVTQIDELRLTIPSRTWMDCAARIPFEHLVAMGDAILHRRLASPQELERFAQWGHRRRGVINLRRALPMLDAGAESPGESLARTMLVLGGVPSPRCNTNIYERGRWLARVDMAWLAARVIVEYDGAGHLEEAQRRRDAERLNQLQEAGWRVIVLTADDLRRPEATCLLVRRAIEQRSLR